MRPFERSDWIVDYEDFEKDRSRPYGFCTQRSTGRKCVQKTVSSLKKTENRLLFEREIQALGSFDHPALVPFVGFCDYKKNGFIYQEEIERGSLFDNIAKNNLSKSKNRILNDTKILIIAYGVACGMEILHHYNFIHRDLSTQNILLNDKFYPYIANFSNSKQIDYSFSICQSINQTTPIIMSPEFYIDPKKHSNKPYIDIYSYGITLYHLVTGIEPFKNFSIFQIFQALVNKERPGIPNFISANWRNLIKDCWQDDPSKRPSFSTICDLLESEDFVNDSIDVDEFNEYKSIVGPLRPNPKAKNQIPKIISPKAKSDLPATSPKRLDQLRTEAATNLKTRFDLAKAISDGTFGEPDFEEAFRHFLSVANEEENDNRLRSLAEYEAAKCMINQEKYDNARAYLIRSSYHGNNDAPYELAELILARKIKAIRKDEVEALYKRAADSGNVNAIKKYSHLLRRGYFSGFPNNEKANHYARMGSDNGDPKMMYLWSVQLKYGKGGVEKNTKEARKLLELTATIRYPPAVYDYGMSLLKSDTDEALNFFMEGAKHNHCPSMLCCALLLDEEDPQSNEYLDRCLRIGTVPDAWALQGRMLIDGKVKYIDQALPSLLYAAAGGSYYGFVELGKICEIDAKYGNPDFYFRQAAHHCHGFDSLEGKIPFPIEVYHCNDCVEDICFACAKACHKNHNVELLQTSECFVCSCKNHKTCSYEWSGDVKCLQHVFQCEQCSGGNDKLYICAACAENCHSGHNLVDCGLMNEICSCGAQKMKQCKCSLLKYEQFNTCSKCKKTGINTKQRYFNCVNCGLYGSDDTGICFECAKSCHKGHILIDLGIQNQICKCTCSSKK